MKSLATKLIVLTFSTLLLASPAMGAGEKVSNNFQALANFDNQVIAPLSDEELKLIEGEGFGDILIGEAKWWLNVLETGVKDTVLAPINTVRWVLQNGRLILTSSPVGGALDTIGFLAGSGMGNPYTSGSSGTYSSGSSNPTPVPPAGSTSMACTVHQCSSGPVTSQAGSASPTYYHPPTGSTYNPGPVPAPTKMPVPGR